MAKEEPLEFPGTVSALSAPPDRPISAPGKPFSPVVSTVLASSVFSGVGIILPVQRGFP